MWAKAEYICCCGDWLARWRAWAAAAGGRASGLVQHGRYWSSSTRGTHPLLPAGAAGAGLDWWPDGWGDRRAVEAPPAGLGL